MEILKRVGVGIQDRRVLDLLGKNGCEVNINEKVAKIPESLVKDCVSISPSKVNMVGRDKNKRIKLGIGKTYFANQDASFVEDIKTGKWRESTKKDVVDFTKLNDALENVDLPIKPTARDLDSPVVDLYEFFEVAKNTSKPFHMVPYRGADSIRDFVVMEEVIMREKSDDHLFSVVACCASPLLWDKWSLDVLSESAKNKIPLYVAGQPVLGGTGPVTIAGTLVVGTAEVMSGVVIAELINRGAPVIYWDGAYPLDMRTGLSATGSPEHSIVNIAVPQIARYLKIPSCVISLTDSCTFDVQSGYEKALSFLPSILSKADIVWGIGGMGPSVSYTQAVMDNEIVDMCCRVGRWMEVDDYTLALDVIEKVGIGGTYIGTKHTKEAHHRELAKPRLSNRLQRATWEKKGSKSMDWKACEMVKEILSTHEPSLIEKDVVEELRSIVEGREKLLIKSSPLPNPSKNI